MTGALIVGSLAIGFAAVGILAYVLHLDEAHPWPFIPQPSWAPSPCSWRLASLTRCAG